MRRAKVLFKDKIAGILEETETGYRFEYNVDYLKAENAEPVSLTLPLQGEPFEQRTMFAFFDGLIPEGWLLEVATDSWKVSPRDRMGLLLVCCKDCIGAVSIVAEGESK